VAALLLAGCSSPGRLSGVYLVALSYDPAAVAQSGLAANETRNLALLALRNATAASSFEVRVSYFGLCATSGDVGWQCAADISPLEAYLTPEADPLRLLEMAGKIKDEIIFPGFL